MREEESNGVRLQLIRDNVAFLPRSAKFLVTIRVMTHSSRARLFGMIGTRIL